MFEGASHLIFANAKHLRKNMTAAETVLWMYLKVGIDGFKFRRQHPINRFIVDFYCVKIKLVIEVDGDIHEIPENKIYDIGRSQILNDFGISVIRFSNKQIMDNIEYVLKLIEENIKQLIKEME